MSSEVLYGKLLNVVTVPSSALVYTTAAQGASVVIVTGDIDLDFNGGAFKVGETVYPYTSITETAIEDDGVSSTQLFGINLTSPLPTALEAEITLYAEPYSESREAMVDLGDGGDAVIVTIPHNLSALVEDGVRSVEERESVVIAKRGYEYVITDIAGESAHLRSDTIDFPDVEVPDPTDGVAPSTSPKPVATGGIGSVFLRWDAITNADPVTYEVHASTMSGFTPNVVDATSGKNVLFSTAGPGVIADNATPTVDLPTFGNNTDVTFDLDMSSAGAGEETYLGYLTARELVTGTTVNNPAAWFFIYFHDNSLIELVGYHEDVDGNRTSTSYASGTYSRATDKSWIVRHDKAADTVKVFVLRSGNYVQIMEARVDARYGSNDGGYLSVGHGDYSDATTLPGTVSLTNIKVLSPSTTKIAETTGTTLNINKGFDGTPLRYNETYYFRVIARDEDGAAAPSAEVSASPVQVTGPDIAANYVYAGNIVANQITGGEIQSDLLLSGNIKTAESGARTELSPAGLVIYDSENVPQTNLSADGNASFKGVVEAEGFTSTGGASFRGENNEISRGGTLRLATGTTASMAAPTVVVDHENTNVAPSATYGNIVGLASDGVSGYSAIVRNTANTTTAVLPMSITGVIGAGHYSYHTAALLGPIIKPVGKPPVEMYNNGDTLFRHGTTSESFDYYAPLNALPPTFATYGGAGMVGTDFVLANNPDYSGIASTTKRRMRNRSVRVDYDFTGTQGFVQELTMRVQYDTNNYMLMVLGRDADRYYTYCEVNSNSVFQIKVVDRVANPNDTNFRRMEIREDNGSIEFMVAGVSVWKTPHTITSARLAAMDIEISAGGHAANGSTIRLKDLAVHFASNKVPYNRINKTELPALGTNAAGDIIVAEYDAANQRYVIKTLDYENMKTVKTTVTTGTHHSYKGNLAGVLYGNFDFGTPRYVLRAKGNNYWITFNTAGVEQSNEAFASDTGNSVGIGWDGTRFVSLGADRKLYYYTSNTWSGALTATWNAAFTWYDADPIGGLHETSASPRRSFTMNKRSRVSVTSPKIPDQGGTDDPDSVRFYMANVASGTLRLQTTAPVGVNSVVLTSTNFSGATPPASNDFPAAVGARIVNGSETLIIDGSGLIKGYVQPLCKEIGVVDLDAFTTPGRYSQSFNAQATSGTHYPANLAGILEVLNNEAEMMIYQTYTAYNGGGVWVRQCYQGNWNEWKSLINEAPYDTGWVPLVETTHWRHSGLTCRRYQDTVFLRGATRIQSGGTMTGTVMFNVPTAMRPAITTRLGPIINAGGYTLGSLTVSTAGDVVADPVYASNTTATPGSFFAINLSYMVN